LRPEARFCGIGGKNLERAGVHILFHSSEMAVVGLTEAVVRIRTIFRAARRVKTILREKRPDLLILLDYPEFNLYLAKFARRLNIPVLYYISPQVWAWRKGRVKKIARRITRMAVILPFEKDFYRKRGIQVDYVGHPLMDRCRETVFIERNSQVMLTDDADGPVIGLLPGSRKEEIRNLLPEMIKAVKILKRDYPRILCLLPLADTISREFIHPFIDNAPVNIQIREGEIHETLGRCDLAMVTSGTATLDTAIMAVPMVVVYRVSRLSYLAGKALIRVPFISLVNLVAGKKVVCELIQDNLTAETLAYEAGILLRNKTLRERMRGDLMEVRRLLGRGGASEKTARIAVDMMEKGA
ncbi:MAG TPA: lipid-A-disaccharide synthase, partial [Deltaproteobacteria bacterium]|nr:lipid-A-disaccharide synthase [Deltaproteobacteria bacterium]